MFSSTSSARGIDRERRRVGAAEHLDLALPEFDVAGRQVVVDRALGPLADDTGDAQHVLAAHVDVVVDHTLDDAGVVAQVDEGEVLAVLAAAADPAADADGLADVLGAQLAAQVGAHRGRRWVEGVVSLMVRFDSGRTGRR